METALLWILISIPTAALGVYVFNTDESGRWNHVDAPEITVLIPMILGLIWIFTLPLYVIILIGKVITRAINKAADKRKK